MNSRRLRTTVRIPGESSVIMSARADSVATGVARCHDKNFRGRSGINRMCLFFEVSEVDLLRPSLCVRVYRSTTRFEKPSGIVRHEQRCFQTFFAPARSAMTFYNFSVTKITLNKNVQSAYDWRLLSAFFAG